MRWSKWQLFVTITMFWASAAHADQLPELGGGLTDRQVTLFAELVLKNIATEFPNKPSNVLLASARQHAEIGLRYVFSGHYSGEHWLATFAIYALKPPH